MIHVWNYTRLFAGEYVSQKSVHFKMADEYDGSKKRTELGQLLKILESLYSSGDMKISSIARFTNMSHDAATRKCEKLVKAGLVVQEIANNNKKYMLTSDGISFLQSSRNFVDILNMYNLGHVLYH